METKLQLRIQRYGWDAAEALYEDAWSTLLLPAQQALLEMSDLQQGQDVIETAAGTGLVTFPVAEIIGQEGSILATDLSEKMVESGYTATEKNGLTNITFQRMNAEALECEDSHFDRALCALGLMYFPQPLTALKEMKRVLRPGGRACVAVWGERSNCGWAEIFPIVDAQVNSAVCPLFFGLGAPNALVSSMKSAGFLEVQQHRIETTLSFQNQERLLTAMIDGGAVALAAKRFSDDTRNTVEKNFIASVADFRNENGSYDIPGEFIVASGIA